MKQFSTVDSQLPKIEILNFINEIVMLNSSMPLEKLFFAVSETISKLSQKNTPYILRLMIRKKEYFLMKKYKKVLSTFIHVELVKR